MHARLGNAADRVAAAPDGRRCRCATSGRCGPPAAAPCSTSDLRDRRFGYPLEMVVRAARAGWRVVEVDVDYAPRGGRPVEGDRYGRAAPLRTVRDMTRVLGA